jgi:hypothetical protein
MIFPVLSLHRQSQVTGYQFLQFKSKKKIRGLNYLHRKDFSKPPTSFNLFVVSSNSITIFPGPNQPRLQPLKALEQVE